MELQSGSRRPTDTGRDALTPAETYGISLLIWFISAFVAAALSIKGALVALVLAILVAASEAPRVGLRFAQATALAAGIFTQASGNNLIVQGVEDGLLGPQQAQAGEATPAPTPKGRIIKDWF